MNKLRRSGKRKPMEKKQNLRKGGVYLTTNRTREQLTESMLADITQISRPTMMENKADSAGVLYGSVEEGQFWLMKSAEKNSGFAPQRILSGFFGRQEEKTILVGKFGFVRGFHLMWLLCTVIGAVAMLMMLHSPVVAAVTAVICLVCWIAASVGGCVKYKAEEQAVCEYLRALCASEEEEEEASAEE